MTDGVTYLVWHDLAGTSRTRGVPTANLSSMTATGLGWACAGQALTAFGSIVDNPWGPMDEVRQVPDMEAQFTLPPSRGHGAFRAVICDTSTSDGALWDCCGRGFLRKALDALKAETGLTLMASFEHEFLLTGEGYVPSPGFTLAAAMQKSEFLDDLNTALSHAGVRPATLEPEYGDGQYEVSCKPDIGLRAADTCLIARETIREVARRHGLTASFTPKPAADAVGNGAHVHMSLVDEDGRNHTWDPSGPMELSEVAQKFAHGILASVDGLVAITAPSPVSYYRLAPHSWSCGYRAIGLQNREAALRVTPGIGDDAAKAKGHNLEFRPCDGTASPYLVLGALIMAGLAGIRSGGGKLTEITCDPLDMTDAEREAAGVTRLPTSLEAALQAFQDDPVTATMFSDDMRDVYLGIKRWEIEAAAAMEGDQVFHAYRTAY
ncbi:type I glutamate--ammonia ligase [Chachezhania sediminis]|uniref:glutamine synthetase family protein n=1 Tax=Chachezhania sediminis TaxID=2599291 RepID=UPI00131D6EF2|nr:glutamine synthetase family protein [Chachezhania sediminis]